jgi:hypothetical protein
VTFSKNAFSTNRRYLLVAVLMPLVGMGTFVTTLGGLLFTNPLVAGIVPDTELVDAVWLVLFPQPAPANVTVATAIAIKQILIFIFLFLSV